MSQAEAPKQGVVSTVFEMVGIVLMVIATIILGLWILGVLMSFAGSALEGFNVGIAHFNRQLIIGGEYLRQTFSSLIKFVLPIAMGGLVAWGVGKLFK